MIGYAAFGQCGFVGLVQLMLCRTVGMQVVYGCDAINRYSTGLFLLSNAEDYCMQSLIYRGFLAEKTDGCAFVAAYPMVPNTKPAHKLRRHNIYITGFLSQCILFSCSIRSALR